MTLTDALFNLIIIPIIEKRRNTKDHLAKPTTIKTIPIIRSKNNSVDTDNPTEYNRG